MFLYKDFSEKDIATCDMDTICIECIVYLHNIWYDSARMIIK